MIGAEKKNFVDILLWGNLSPRAAAFLIHALIESVPFDNEEKELKFKMHIRELFLLTNEL